MGLGPLWDRSCSEYLTEFINEGKKLRSSHVLKHKYLL